MTQIKNQELLEKIGLTLKELRKKKGILQTDMLNDTGIHIARVEAAGRNLSVSSLAALLEYLDIKFSDFFKLVEKQK
jgi:transcriptional regulator with XRE-family HTH domain